MKLQWINTFKLHSKKRQLSKAQQIDLLSNLCNLLKYGFTLYQSFQFLNLQMTYKNKQLGTTILSEISNGAPCNKILSLIGYSDTIVLQVYLAERFGNIIDVLEETVNYMKVNRKSEQRLLKTLQYPLILVSIFIAMIIILNLTVIPQFQQLYTSMNIQLSSFQKHCLFHYQLTYYNCSNAHNSIYVGYYYEINL